MIQPATPSDDDAQTTDEATEVAPRRAEDLDPPTGDLHDERRRGYEPL